MSKVHFVIHLMNYDNMERKLCKEEYMKSYTGNIAVRAYSGESLLEEDIYTISLNRSTEVQFKEKIDSIIKIVAYQRENIERKYPSRYSFDIPTYNFIENEVMYEVNNHLYTRWVNVYAYSSEYYKNNDSEKDSIGLVCYQKDFKKGRKIFDVKYKKIVSDKTEEECKETILEQLSHWNVLTVPKELDTIIKNLYKKES